MLVDIQDVDSLTLSEIPDAENDTANHYVDNVKLHEVFVAYNEARVLAHDTETEKPKIPDLISRSIIDVANNLSYNRKYINYPFKEDMIGDGIENFLKYGVNNYDHTKYKNPFAYMTQCIGQAFVRRIKKEKRQYYYKLKMFDKAGGFEAYTDEHNDEHVSSIVNESTEQYKDYLSQIAEYEEKQRLAYEKNKDAKPAPEPEDVPIVIGLDQFMED